MIFSPTPSIFCIHVFEIVFSYIFDILILNFAYSNHRKVEYDHLGQIKTVMPQAYVFKQTTYKDDVGKSVTDVLIDFDVLEKNESAPAQSIIDNENTDSVSESTTSATSDCRNDSLVSETLVESNVISTGIEGI